MINSEEELCKTFNEFFINKIDNIAEHIPKHDIDPVSKLKEKLQQRNLFFSLTEVSEAKVRKAIKSIKSKTSSGVDFVSSKILKSAI